MAYTIQRGDTLNTLAKKYNTTVNALMSANPSIKDPNKIYAGASLTLPTVTPIKAVTPAATTTAKVTPINTAPVNTAPVTAITPTVSTSSEPVNPYSDYVMNSLTSLQNSVKSMPAYDVTTDPLYAPLKQQYEQAGQTAFNNTIGRLSALTGGRPSTAAVGTATAANNQYAQEFASKVLPELTSQYYDRYNQNLQNQLSILSKTMGVEDTAYDRQEKVKEAERQAFFDTIGQYYDNIQLRINQITNDNDTSNDWQIPYLKTERQEKLKTLEAAKAEAEKTEYERGIEQTKLTNDTNYTNAQISNLAADNARLAAGSSGSDPEPTLTTTQYFNQAKDLLNERVATGQTDSDSKPIYRPKYTKEQFETWLNNALPKTPKGDKMYDDIIAALDIDNVEFYKPAPQRDIYWRTK